MQSDTYELNLRVADGNSQRVLVGVEVAGRCSHPERDEWYGKERVERNYAPQASTRPHLESVRSKIQSRPAFITANISV